MSAEVLRAVRELTDEVAALRRELGQAWQQMPGRVGGRVKRLRPEDREALERLLPLVSAVVGSAPAPVGDWWESRCPDRAAVDALRRELGQYSPRAALRLGQLLGRAAGVPVGGFVVQRTGVRDESGAWWQVQPIQHDAADGT